MTLFALIADLLVTDAFVHAFPPGRGGRIAVSFTAAQGAWQLTVEDSGIAVRSQVTGATMARRSRGSSSCGSADGWRFLE